jgi:hypothetical protein
LDDNGGPAQISIATRVLAEIIASDVSLLVTFNHAIDKVASEQSASDSKPQSGGSTGRLHEAAREISISSSVRDGENCESESLQKIIAISANRV